VSGILVQTFQGIIQQLQQKERVLTQMQEYILQSVPSGIVTFSPEGLVTTANPAAERIFGIEREKILGTSYETIFGINSPVQRFMKESLEQKKEVILEECEVVQQNGQRKFLGLTASALRDPSGTIIRAIIVSVDLTEIKRLQEQVDLKKRLEMMGEISAWIAHEFRNYMGTIVGYASLLSKELASALPQQEMTYAIRRECATMERLITDLLAYGKKPALTLQQTNLTALIEEIIEPFKTTAPNVCFVITMSPCEIATDSTLMRQALFNLVKNAIEAMENKGTLSVRLTHKEER
jgi:PAS domain S-box-containing protein